MWIHLEDGSYYFGATGITVMKTIDLRDKPATYIARTELYVGKDVVAKVQETVQEIMEKLCVRANFPDTY